MNLYLDTSALVKLYVDEEGAARMRDAIDQSSRVATSEIAYVEFRATLARRRREKKIGVADYRRGLHDFEVDWGSESFLVIAVRRDLIYDAASHAERYALRAFDSLHLSAALAVQERLGEDVVFACWDVALTTAASKAGLRVLTR